MKHLAEVVGTAVVVQADHERVAFANVGSTSDDDDDQVVIRTTDRGYVERPIYRERCGGQKHPSARGRWNRDVRAIVRRIISNGRTDDIELSSLRLSGSVV